MDAGGRATHGAVAERVGERKIKSAAYIPLIPAFSLKGEGAGTCVDTYVSGLYTAGEGDEGADNEVQ